MNSEQLADKFNLSIGIVVDNGTQPSYRLTGVELQLVITALRMMTLLKNAFFWLNTDHVREWWARNEAFQRDHALIKKYAVEDWWGTYDYTKREH